MPPRRPVPNRTSVLLVVDARLFFFDRSRTPRPTSPTVFFSPRPSKCSRPRSRNQPARNPGQSAPGAGACACPVKAGPPATADPVFSRGSDPGEKGGLSSCRAAFTPNRIGPQRILGPKWGLRDEALIETAPRAPNFPTRMDPRQIWAAPAPTSSQAPAPQRVRFLEDFPSIICPHVPKKWENPGLPNVLGNDPPGWPAAPSLEEQCSPTTREPLTAIPAESASFDDPEEPPGDRSLIKGVRAPSCRIAPRPPATKTNARRSQAPLDQAVSAQTGAAKIHCAQVGRGQACQKPSGA